LLIIYFAVSRIGAICVKAIYQKNYKKSKFVSRVLFLHKAEALWYIYHLSMRPTHCSSPCGNKTGSLKLLQPIWPFNTRGLPHLLITKQVCELLPHNFTITGSFTFRLPGFCGTICYLAFGARHPLFQVAGYPALPGLSSPG
jgi:hypothetical protein